MRCWEPLKLMEHHWVLPKPMVPTTTMVPSIRLADKYHRSLLLRERAQSSLLEYTQWRTETLGNLEILANKRRHSHHWDHKQSFHFRS